MRSQAERIGQAEEVQRGGSTSDKPRRVNSLWGCPWAGDSSLGRPEGRVAAVQMALAFGLTALLDVAIVVLVLTG